MSRAEVAEWRMEIHGTNEKLQKIYEKCLDLKASGSITSYTPESGYPSEDLLCLMLYLL